MSQSGSRRTSRRRTILSVVGARPNFMKLAPVARALAAYPDVRHTIVHTGQHYDHQMSDVFFADLQLPEAHHNLGVGSGSHAEQTAGIMVRLEPILSRERPDVVLVYGDVNSTVAAALVAAKAGVRIGHVEAGLRSGDRAMPEEVNRIVTDRLSDVLFAPSPDAVRNLWSEGVAPGRIHFVGNVMIDTLVSALPVAREVNAPCRHGLTPNEYALVTLHRPNNVDEPATLRELVATLSALAEQIPVVFPVHPRTRERLVALGSHLDIPARLRLLDPISYPEMLGLVDSAGVVITDSGGLQEETTFLGVRCVTVRPNTERPITCTVGTNVLVAARRTAILDAVRAALNGADRGARRIDRWDGETAERIAKVLLDGERYHWSPPTG